MKIKEKYQWDWILYLSHSLQDFVEKLMSATSSVDHTNVWFGVRWLIGWRKTKYHRVVIPWATWRCWHDGPRWPLKRHPRLGESKSGQTKGRRGCDGHPLDCRPSLSASTRPGSPSTWAPLKKYMTKKKDKTINVTFLDKTAFENQSLSILLFLCEHM
jgi:hypothetical protein